jgi:glutamine cyclotransferase
MTNRVVVIDPNTGMVLEEIDCTELEIQGKNGGDVLNGIAYNNGKIYMTGKYWNKLFEVKKVAF